MYSDFYAYGPGVMQKNVSNQRQDVTFHFVQEENYGEDFGIFLYDMTGEQKVCRIPFSEEERRGCVYQKVLENLEQSRYHYQFYVGDHVVPDSRGVCFVKKPYGEPRKEDTLKAKLPVSFDWKGDVRPKVPFEDMVLYGMHVRGFTAHPSSKVKAPGTFAGVTEKISYLKSIGVTSVEFQPIYEFIEKPMPKKESFVAEPFLTPSESMLNYWGYQRGYYFAPKAAYGAGERADVECKEMIRKLHSANIEVILQFYFQDFVSSGEILSILQFWAGEYHADGFHLIGDGLNMELLTKDPLLSDCKLFYHRFEEKEKDALTLAGRKHLAIYNDDYLYDCRKFLKGDAGMLPAVRGQFSYVPEEYGRIHYLTNYNGFTLCDLVSYNQKHNEANGEDNQDGNDFNYSWNCGEEGPVKNRKVLKLRRKQMQNAHAILLLTASSPYIFMGDEFGNSQMGNNNPYCQDNEITWLDWGLVRKNKALLDNWKRLMELRKAHSVLHPKKMLSLTDTMSCGYPELSIHGTNAWKADSSFSTRHFGMMLCEGSTSVTEQPKLSFLYLAFNLGGEERSLGLPKLPGGLKWQVIYTTDESVLRGESIEENTSLFPGRSVTILFAEGKGEGCK